MKNKSIFISNIIRSLIFIFILVLLLLNNTGLTRLMILPFIICGLAVMGKNICFLLEKNNYANFFSLLYKISFFVFYFGFLLFGSYSVIKTGNFLTLIFTIPFIVLGIYFVRKSLFNSTKEIESKPKKKTLDTKIIVGGGLVILTFFIGVGCLFFGIKETVQLNKTTKDYLTTNGYFSDYHIYRIDKEETTYELIYTYEVKGKNYTVSTNYGTNYIPEENSVREVKYDPDDPSKSILVGTNNYNFLIYFGAFFALGSFAFILGGLYIKGVFDKIKIDIMGLYFGFCFFLIGIGIILFQNGTTTSLLETIKAFGAWIIIPILFIIVGLFQIIKCLFLKPAKKNQ